MLGFYRAVSRMDSKKRNLAVTMLDKEGVGEKALVSDGEVVWKSGRMKEDVCLQAEREGGAGIGVCRIGGQDVFCELLGREKKMVVCGGGHVSIPLIQMANMAGFRVQVLEDRPKFADNARQAGAAEVFCEPFEEGLEKIRGDSDTFFVIVTRGHRYDQICLERIARKEHAYIGMLGSRGRVAKVKEAILERGGSPEAINRIYTPIGLDIGAETPEEIAVAIMAEIIQVKSREKSGSYPKEILEAILQDGSVQGEAVQEKPMQKEVMGEGKGRRKVLATIVGRKGSAPRGVGTKMLVLPDGGCIGTIGGGRAEFEIRQKALVLLQEGQESARLCQIDMAAEAEEEGMACGGRIEVLLECL